MEIRLISLRIPFMKLVALPCGKQKAIHGPAVNVPADLHPVCDLLPRLPSQIQIVPMKLKRKLCYKGHYMYSFVRPSEVIIALEWLKNNDPLHKDVNIDQEWIENAIRDDGELWEAISSQQSEGPSQSLQPSISDLQQQPQSPKSPQHLESNRLSASGKLLYLYEMIYLCIYLYLSVI